MIQFGTNPIAWANDDDTSIGADIPTERILDEAGRQIGFEGIENGHRWPDDPAALGALLGSYGLKFISGWYSTELLTRSVADEIAAFQPHLAKLKANGCKICIACETLNAVHSDPLKAVDDKPLLDDARMRAFGAKLEEFADYMQGHGIRMAYHHHMGTVVETPAEIDALMAATGPAAGLLFDTGHCLFGGGDPQEVLARHIGRVVHVHAKNLRPDVARHVRDGGLSFIAGVLEGAFTVPGDQEGAIDFKPLLQQLADHGYDGWIVIEAEQNPAERNPLLYQTLGLATLKRLAREVGLIGG